MASNIRVLLVDDNPMILALLRQAIQPFASVETLRNATEALMHVVESPPDLLISDYSMPELNGKQLIEKIPVARLVSFSDVRTALAAGLLFQTDVLDADALVQRLAH